MEAVEAQLQRVEEKVQQLLKRYQLDQKEMQRLQKENALLQEELEKKKTQSAALHQTIDSLKINTLTLDQDSRKDLEKRINLYLKEIDKCLSLLNS
jgi:predicted nuclease with TOPRIM domain